MSLQNSSWLRLQYRYRFEFITNLALATIKSTITDLEQSRLESDIYNMVATADSNLTTKQKMILEAIGDHIEPDLDAIFTNMDAVVEDLRSRVWEIDSIPTKQYYELVGPEMRRILNTQADKVGFDKNLKIGAGIVGAALLINYLKKK